MPDTFTFEEASQPQAATGGAKTFSFEEAQQPADTLAAPKPDFSIPTPSGLTSPPQRIGGLDMSKMGQDNKLPTPGVGGQAWETLWKAPKPMEDIVDVERGSRQQQRESDTKLRAMATKAGLNPDDFAKAPGAAELVLQGSADELVDLSKMALSPGGVLTAELGTATKIPAALKRIVSLAFAAQMLKQTPEAAGAFMDEMKKPPAERDYVKIGQTGAGTVASAVLGTMGLKAGVSPSKSGPMQGPLATGRVLRTPAGAQPPEAPAATLTPPPVKTEATDAGKASQTHTPDVPLSQLTGKIARWNGIVGTIELGEDGRLVLNKPDIQNGKWVSTRYELPGGDVSAADAGVEIYTKQPNPQKPPAPAAPPVEAAPAPAPPAQRGLAPEELPGALSDLADTMASLKQQIRASGFQPDPTAVQLIDAVHGVASMKQPPLSKAYGALEALPNVKRMVTGIIGRLESEGRHDETQPWYDKLDQIEQFEAKYQDTVTNPGATRGKAKTADILPAKPASDVEPQTPPPQPSVATATAIEAKPTPPPSPSVVKPGQAGLSNDAVVSEKPIQSGRIDAELLGNLANSDAFKKHGFDGLDIKSQKMMKSAVLRMVREPQVLNSIVKLVPVDVVNNLRAGKFPAKIFLHNPTMLSDILDAIKLKDPVSFGVDAPGSPIIGIAPKSAEVSGTGIPARRAGQSSSAKITGQSFHEPSVTESPVVSSKEGKAETPAKPRLVSKRGVAADAKKFNDLLREHAERLGLAQGQTLADLQMQHPGKTNLGSVGILGSKKIGEALKKVKAVAARRLGLNEDQMGEQSYLAQHLPKLQKLVDQKDKFDAATADEGASKLPVPVKDLEVGETITVDGEPVKVSTVNKNYVVLDDGRKFGRQEVDGGETLYVEGYEPKETPALELDKPESVDEQKARETQEQAARVKKAQAEELAKRAAKPLVGSRGDIGQTDMLGGGDLLSQPLKPEGEGKIGVGPGAATAGNPEEFGKTGDYVSNMFAAINRDRAAMGKGPMPATQRRTWDEDNQKALAKMNREPDWIPRLINEVKDKPRPLLSWEQAGLVWHRDGLVTEAHNAMRKINQAFEDGRQDDLIQAKQDTARFEDEILALDDVVGRNGTGSEAGRSLNAQKMGAGEDFTLVQMVLEKRAKKGGRPLTDAERAQVEKEHAEYEQLVSERDAALQREKESQARIAEMEVKAALDKIALEAKQHPTYHPSIMAAAERIVVGFENRAKVASTKLREMLSRSSALVDPMIFKYVTEIGAAKIARFSLDSAKWAKAMLDEYGPKIKDYVDEKGYQAAKQFMEDNLSKVKGANAEKIKRAVRGTDLNQKKTIIGEQIAKKISSGKRNDITNAVQRLARIFVEQGIKTRDGLIDAVHSFLTEIDPEITRRDAMDAISGYGDFRQLSKDEISVTLRGLKGQMQQVAKLEDMQAGKPPLKTGAERRVVTPEESKLIQQVNDAKRKFQIPIDDPNMQLRSSLDELKKRMQTRIAELQEKLAAKDFSTKQRRPVHLDADALRTQANLNRWKVKYERAKAIDEEANRAWWQKTLQQVSGFAKASALSGYHTLGKLASYTAAKLIEKPLTETAGYVASKLPITRDIFKQTKFESPNIRALARYYTGFAKEGMREAKQQLRTGESDIKATYGKPRVQPRKWYDFFGNLHASEKAPLRTGAFYSNLENAEAWALRNGLDPSDEFVQGALRWDSSVEADREILQENNAFANEVNGVIARLEKTEKSKDRLTGKVVEHFNPTKSALAAILKTFVTKGIVRTPANYVMQSLEHSPAGLTFGISRAAKAWKAGAENLSPAQSDAIARLIKVGAVGSAMFVWGAIDATLNPDKRTFGGYYQPGDKRNPDDVLFGTIRIPGIANKRWTHIITHNPATEAAQMGSTFMRVALSRLRKKDKENQGALAGVIAATIGLANQAPVAGSGLRLAKIQNPNEQSRIMGDLIKGLIPQLVQNIAEDTDATDDYRPPKTVGQDVELGVPGLRQNVPAKKGQGVSTTPSDPRIGTIITGSDGRKYRVASVDANGKLHGIPVP